MPPRTRYAASGDVPGEWRLYAVDVIEAPVSRDLVADEREATILVHLSRRSGAHGSEGL